MRLQTNLILFFFFNFRFRSQFVQNLLLATLTPDFRVDVVLTEDKKKLEESMINQNVDDSNLEVNRIQAVSDSIHFDGFDGGEHLQ